MKKIFALSLVLLLSVSFLSGCGSKEKESSGETAETSEELETIVFTEPVRGYHWAPAYLAQTLGYFEEVGLQAEFQTVSGADASAPVFSGDAQFGLRGVEMALIAAEKEQGCKILVSTTSRYPYQLVGANEQYSTVQSLKGGAIAGGQGASSAPHAFSKAILLHEGFTPDVDVSVLSMKSSAYVAAMESGGIQAAVSTNPWAAKTLMENGGVVIVDGSDEKTMQDLMGTTTYELFMIFTSDQYIEENPETVQKTVTAIAKAIQWMNKASAEDIATELEPLFEGKYEEILYSAQVDKENRLHNSTGYHSDSGYAAALELTKLSGAINTDIPADKVYDESFLDLAWQELSKE